MESDVTIVGGGPAGLACALRFPSSSIAITAATLMRR